MKALIINLAEATERMEFQTRQLDSLGIEYKRLEAISVNNLKQGIYKKYHSTWERGLRESEVACFLSHKKAWEEVVKANGPVLILEDDALLSQTIVCVLDVLKNRHDLDYVTLEARGRKKIIAKKAKSEFCESSLIRLYQDRTGAAGYVLWPTGAIKLLDRLGKGKIALADAFISSTYTLDAYQIEPATIIQLDQCEYYGIISPFKAKSSISCDRKPLAKKSRQWSFRMKRILGQLRIGVRQLSVATYSTRKHVLVSRYFKP